MNCIHCRGAMYRSTAPIHIDRNGYHLALDSVPAWICGQCGEPHFEAREVDALQDAIRGLDEQTRQLVPDVAPRGGQQVMHRPLDPELLSHLKAEFGSHGHRAVEFLFTAWEILSWIEQSPDDVPPRVAETVAYCLREAMTEIPQSQNARGSSWSNVSREVCRRQTSVRTSRALSRNGRRGSAGSPPAEDR